MPDFRGGSPRIERGFTLVELMTVILIIGILAGLAILAYSSQVDKAQVNELRRFALEVEKGQHQYASRNGRYFTPQSSQQPYTPGDAEWEELLEFKHDNLHPDIRVMTEAGTPSDQCNTYCPTDLEPNYDQNWYAIKVCRDLDGNTSGGTDCSDDTMVYLDSSVDKPVVLNEGK